MPETIHHALVLNLHQPSGNVEHLLTNNEWEAKEILWALDRIPRSLWGFEDIARVHLSFSGTLLETLSNIEFQNRVYGIVKCGDLLWHFQNTKLFELLGTAFYHSVIPLIPKADWHEQCRRWKGIGSHLFGRNNFPGFWPPEMGFCMEMIPMIRDLGYKYVLVDSENVEPLESMRWEELRYQPHIARFEDSEIIVIVRDRELSDAQESGMEWSWFYKEVNERVKWCDFHPLVTTITDGDNGGWFRNTSGNGNFWEVFYKEFLLNVKEMRTNIRPAFISDYLTTYGAKGYVNVATAAWNTGWHNGKGFVQWTGSQLQKDALNEVSILSKRFHTLKENVTLHGQLDLSKLLDEAYWHLLRSQTSCNFFWGEAWVYKCRQDVSTAEQILNQVESEMIKITHF
jgi:alpha-amylase/alpha-mannosidase (GH57 family)